MKIKTQNADDQVPTAVVVGLAVDRRDVPGLEVVLDVVHVQRANPGPDLAQAVVKMTVNITVNQNPDLDPGPIPSKNLTTIRDQTPGRSQWNAPILDLVLELQLNGLNHEKHPGIDLGPGHGPVVKAAVNLEADLVPINIARFNHET